MSQLPFYVASFVLALAILIAVHELGHYLAARWLGVKVLRFSLGFGRTVWQRRFGRDGTEWAVGLVPLGGYVKMLDEREGEVAPEEAHRSFNRQSVWRRIAIVAAGPLANIVLAILLYWGLFCHGVEEPRALIGRPAIHTPAAQAGFEEGERVVKLAGEAVETWQDMRWLLLKRAVDQDFIEFEVLNRKNELTVRRLDVSAARGDGWGADAMEALGLTFFRPKLPPIVGKVSAGSAAAAAGLLAGDKILAIDAAPTAEWIDVVRTVRASPGRPLSLDIERQGRRFAATMTPESVEEKGESIGRIGVMVKGSGLAREDLMVLVRYDPWTALGKAVDETWDKSVFSLVMIGKMITGEVSWRNISGPVTIADYAGQSAKLGVDYYLKFLALISLSLAVLNLLPIPILDGGHLLYYLVEIIRGKPLSERVMELGQRVGLSLLALLMVFAFYNDFNRLISG